MKHIKWGLALFLSAFYIMMGLQKFGAMGFHLSPWLGINVVVEPGGSPTPLLFIMAMFFTAINLIVLHFERNKIKSVLLPHKTMHVEA